MNSGIHPGRRTATVVGAALGGAAMAAKAAHRRRPRIVTGQVMSSPPVTLDADATVSDAAETFAASGVGALPLCDGDGRAIGMLTDRDLVVRVLCQDGQAPEWPVREIAEAPPVVADATEPVSATAERMRRLGVRRLPVVAHGRVTGVVSRGDVIRHLPARAARALHHLRADPDPGQRSRGPAADGRSARWLFRRAYA